MALQSSGQITIANIVTEFGGAAPHNLTEYYRGGAYVPDGPAGNASIPTSGQITLKDFYGAAASTVVTVTEGTVVVFNYASWGYVRANKVPQYSPTPVDFNEATSAAGSRTPTTLSGVTIQAIAHGEGTKGSNDRFFVVLQGTRAKTFFTSVLPQGGSTLTTASSYHTQVSNSTMWVWNDVTPTGWNGYGTRTATFI